MSSSFSPNQYFTLIVGLSNFAYVMNTYVNWRQYRVYKTQLNAPKEVASICTVEEYEKSRLYGLDKARFGLIQDLFSQVYTNITLMFGLLLLFWNASGNLLQKYSSYGDSEVSQSVVFTTINLLASTIFNIPFSYYSTFYIEQKHGFNKQTVGLWIKDAIKSLVLSILIMSPITAAFLWTVNWAGQNFYLAVWIVMAVIQLVMLLIYPTFIQPLFNKFEPLPEGDLKTSIEALAHKLAFPLTKIFVMDGSTRSSHSNAYFYGILKDKRIVLYDTLLNQMDNNEICAVLGHELGHWSCNHLIKRLSIVQAHLFIMFYLFSKIISEKQMYQAFGFSTLPIMIGFTLFSYLLTPIEMICKFVMICQSRSHEFEADRFANNLGYGKLLQSALIKLYAKNRALVQPDWLYSTLNYSHPPMPERLAALKDLTKSKKA